MVEVADCWRMVKKLTDFQALAPGKDQEEAINWVYFPRLRSLFSERKTTVWKF